LAALGGYLGQLLPNLDIVVRILNFAISFGVITLLFAMIYRILPDVKIAWGDVWLGAAITSLLFSIGRWAIGLYLGNSSVGSTYGAAGSFVVFLLWVNYSAQILFFGAEFTQVYANKYGSQIVPDKNAVPLTDEARAKQGIPHTHNLNAAADAQEQENQHSATSTALREPEKKRKSVHPVAVALSLLISGYRSFSRLLGGKRGRNR